MAKSDPTVVLAQLTAYLDTQCQQAIESQARHESVRDPQTAMFHSGMVYALLGAREQLRRLVG